MDIEGAELELLNTVESPVLLNCDVLVELHDCFYSGLTEKIIGYFEATHKIEIVFDYPWRVENYFVENGVFDCEDRRFILDERRPKAMRWMYARVK